MNPNIENVLGTYRRFLESLKPGCDLRGNFVAMVGHIDKYLDDQNSENFAKAMKQDCFINCLRAFNGEYESIAPGDYMQRAIDGDAVETAWELDRNGWSCVSLLYQFFSKSATAGERELYDMLHRGLVTKEDYTSVLNFVIRPRDARERKLMHEMEQGVIPCNTISLPSIPGADDKSFPEKREIVIEVINNVLSGKKYVELNKCIAPILSWISCHFSGVDGDRLKNIANSTIEHIKKDKVMELTKPSRPASEEESAF